MNVLWRDHLEQAEMPVRPAVTALFYTAPRCLRDGMSVNHLVNHHGASIDLFCDAPPASDIAGEDAGGQTVNTVVRQPDRLFFGFESHDRQHRTEGLVAH